MTLTIENLGSGQLSDTPGTVIYTAASPTIIAFISLVNTDGSSTTVNVFHDVGATTVNISGQDLPIDASGKAEIRGPITLDTGDEIQAHAATASIVDYKINGVVDA